MSLLQFGFRRVSSCSRSEEDGEQSRFVQLHLPNLEESGLGKVEYDNVTSTVSELADPSPAAKTEKGKYVFILLKNVRRSVNMPSKMAMKELGSDFWPNFLACVRAPSGISRQLIRSALKCRRNRLYLCQLQHFHVSQGVGHLYYTIGIG